MAEVCTLDWHITPFRADRFLDLWEPIAAKAPAYGAKSWSLIRSIDDPQSFRQTMIAELANGAIGYIPNRVAYSQGNYEVVSARCAEGTGEKLVDEAVKQLTAQFRKK